MQTRTLLVSALVGALPLTVPALGQTVVGPQVQLNLGTGSLPANETTMAASPSNPLEILGGWNDYRDGSAKNGFGLSLDGGETWTDFILRPDPIYQTTTEGDPMTAADPRTGALWAGGITFASNGGIFCARKEPGSATFEPVVMINTGSGIDKGWMAAGPDPADPTGATRVYCAYNFGSQHSVDMGDTWSGVTSLGSGLGFLPRVGPNGEYYVTYWDFGTGVMLARSFDGGVTFDPAIRIATRMDVWGIDGSRVPGDYRVASLNGLAVDPNDGTLYCVYPDTTSVLPNGSNVDVYFSKSVDQGSTWTTPVVINDDAATDPGDQFFPWIEVDEQGRLHLTFLDTRAVAQNDVDSPGFIDPYYAYSDDAGATWTEVRLDSPSWDSGLDGFGDAFIGDYLGMSTAGGRTLPLYVSTKNGIADTFTHVITSGPSTSYCFGIGCPCGNEDPDAGCGNLGIDGDFATGALLEATGTNSAAADDLVLTVSGLKANAPGIVFASASRNNLPFGDGVRCLAGPVKRYPVQLADGAGQLVLGPGQVFSGGPPTAPGDTRYYQSWYRDNGGACGTGTNYSNALCVTWTP